MLFQCSSSIGGQQELGRRRGVAEIGSFFALRSAKSSGYLLVNAGFSLLLAFLIWRNWPYSSSWAIGTLIGVNLITTGFTRLLLSPGRTATLTS